MLFMLGVDVLNRIISWIDDQGFLTDLGCNAAQFWASLYYVDDLVLFVAPRMQDLPVLKTCLDIFVQCSIRSVH